MNLGVNRGWKFTQLNRSADVATGTAGAPTAVNEWEERGGVGKVPIWLRVLYCAALVKAQLSDCSHRGEEPVDPNFLDYLVDTCETGLAN
jgi:hypothetical protein